MHPRLEASLVGMEDDSAFPSDADLLPLSSRGCGTYAFLNHSAATLPNNLPPNVDDKPLARQKRKRTRFELLVRKPRIPN